MESDVTRRLAIRAQQARDLLREVEAAVERGEAADVFLTSLYRRRRQWGARDRRFLSRLVFGALRWRGWLGTFAEAGDRVLIGAHLLEATDRHPVIDHMLRALGEDPGSLPCVGDASLETRAGVVAALYHNSPRSWHTLVPEWTLPALAIPEGEDPEKHQHRCVESFQQRPPLWLRAVGVSAEELARLIRDVEELDARPGPAPQSVVVAGDRPHLPTLERRHGACFETQDLASQMVGWVAAPERGERWWDMCCGAGGKTLHWLAFGADVLPSDIRAPILGQARRRLRRAGRPDIRPFVHDATQPLPGHPRFDGVLCDAPCSGLGMWSRRPDARWQTTPQHVDRYARTQEQLLDNAARHVRPGGRLVYAVCTLTARETTEQVRRFERLHPEFEREPVSHPLSDGRAEWPVWVWPWQGPCGAMFIARWRNRAGE